MFREQARSSEGEGILLGNGAGPRPGAWSAWHTLLQGESLVPAVPAKPVADRCWQHCLL